MEVDEPSEIQVVDFKTILDNFNLEKVHVDRLPGFINDTPQVLDFIRKAMSYTSDVAYDLEETDQTEVFDNLEAGLKECIHLENAIITQKKVFSKLRSDVSSGMQIGEGPPKYNEYWDTEMKNYNNLSDKDKYSAHFKYKEYKEIFWSVNHPDESIPTDDNDDDEDIVVGKTKKSLKCPITTAWLEDPVTSTTCKHTFSKAAILSLIKRAHRDHRNSGDPVISCPIPGCNESLSTESFYDNTVMERLVAMEKEKEKEESSKRPTFHDVE